jgi:uncharacterized cupredoxin-like copper-binding protein
VRFFVSMASLAVLGLFGLGAVACGGDDEADVVADDGPPVSEVMVSLSNWVVEPSSKTLAAGTVTFTAMHEAEHGAMNMAGQEGATHQLLVAPLPKGAKAGQNKFGNPVVNLPDIKPGESMTAEAQLEPGTYELACLIVEEVDGKSVNHYEKGMYTQVTVQ